LAEVDDSLTRYTFSVDALSMYDFFWHDLCDWYLEFAKARLKSEDPAVRRTLFDVFRGTLQLLHPLMPFITEELWQKLGFGRVQGLAEDDRRFAFKGSRVQGTESILQSKWPEPLAVDESDTSRVEAMRELIVAVRTIRAEMQVPAKSAVNCVVNTGDAGLVEFIKAHRRMVADAARVAELTFASMRPPKSSMAVIPGCEIYVPLGDVIDFEQETQRVGKEIGNLRAATAAIDAKFANPNFEQRARPEVVESERQRRQELADKLSRLERQLEGLKE
jgi:valyl-tRNA synthetase